MGKKVIFVLMLFVFLFGLSLLLFPLWNGALVDRQIGQAVEQFLTWEDPTVPETESTNPTEEQRLYAELWEEMCAYNETLYAQKQAGLNGTDDFRESSFHLQDYGRTDEVFAVLTIPKISLDMPVYLGATDGNLASGAAHLSQTSLPIGGENTNCVIAGHRGWNGAAYFRYVPDLEKGDLVTLQNLWETLTYVVVDTQIIAPNDVGAIHIQEGRDMLTLLTCHPYASGGKQRFLVICERIE
ncbi:MAG: class C sortase [Faecousia sp.]